MTRLARYLSVVGLLLLVPFTALVALGASGALGAVGLGVPDPGAVTRWGLPTVRAVHDASAALTVGLLVLAATVLPPERPGPRRPRHPGGRAVLLAAVAGIVWTISGTIVLALTYSDAAGTSAADIGSDALVRFVIDLDLGRSLALSVLLAGVATTCAWLATKRVTVGLAAVTALAALLPLTVTGHGASNHEAAVNLLALHLVGATVWVGGLAGIAALRRTLGPDFAVAVRRYSTLAGWGFTLVLLSGVAGAWLRVDGWSGLASAYGVLLLGKSAAILMLGLAGWAQRRRILPALDADPTSGRAFARVAGIELLLMAVTLGLSVALSRSSPFGLTPVQSTAQSLLGASLPPPLSASAWVTEWRLDVVWAPAALLLGAWYVIGVTRLRRAGVGWDRRRVAAWLAGCAALAWATGSVPAVYGRVMPSMHTLEAMTVGLAVPVLLVLGQPMQLATRTLPDRIDGSWGPREWLAVMAGSRIARVISVPVVSAALYAGTLTLLFLSPALALALSSNTVRMLTTVLALLVGLGLANSLTTPARPRSRGHGLTARIGILLGLLLLHAVTGLRIMLSGEPIGGDWYAKVRDLWDLPVMSDQLLAGQLLWGAGIYPLLLLGVVIAAQDGRRRPPLRAAADRTADGSPAAGGRRTACKPVVHAPVARPSDSNRQRRRRRGEM